MFTPDFYPTPPNVIETMFSGQSYTGKVILEPSAGKGNIVEWLKDHGAEVIACENHPDLRKIVASKCPIVADDFFTLESHQVSHIHIIAMNPPFSKADLHILHAFKIAPAGCEIIALCNTQSVENPYSATRKELAQIVEEYGSREDLGECFTTAERKTDVKVSLLRITKAGKTYDQEFEGFLLDDEPEEQGEGIMQYNLIRDLVNRYIGAVKIFDAQLDAAVKMEQLTTSFFTSKLAMSCTQDGKQIQRNQFKKDLQKSAWAYIFNKLDMAKFATRGLKEDINKFVERQHHIPFTMTNVYKMLEIVVGTQNSRIDRAVLEVFDKVTKHHHDNRYNVEGWKTNSHYLLTKKFIHPGLFELNYSKNYLRVSHKSGDYELLDDLHKTLCHLTGKDYTEIGSIWEFNKQYPQALTNTWYEFGFFRIKGFKKGTAHVEFKDDDTWAIFNQQVAKLKGYPLFESKERGSRQPHNKYGHTTAEKVKPTILASFKISA